ncbi:DUF6457 domain-containing protein [Plantactinospora sp. KLBMP9567]|uniref:DUF6457 domain-containing protein n=1 Tax=Plantactinospora sp. KLBMP9567 TaxID=3085900 RepID=UPI00298204DA|nr:DUF6457 domain-containing protein [Plantactinospora sp. KLBMP9567]MDW5328005.1 DUF6457 domain-containing protein [Plantactinospora sp. KLBMP9567]
MSVLDEWTRQAIEELGLDPDVLDQRLVLDVARDVAHGVTRPAAPLGTFLLGVMVGRGATLPEAADRLTRLAERWSRRDSGR